MPKLFGIKFGRRGNSVGNVTKGPAPGIDILPPFGTEWPNFLVNPPKKALKDLGTRLINGNPFDSWYLTLPAKLQPQQVLNILRSAQGGDVWQLAQLDDLCLTMWPMYKKCTCELQEAVSSVKFDVHPYCEEGEEPTDSAAEKADFVRRCFNQMSPNPGNDERDLRGTIYHLAHVLLMGVGMQEIIWNEPKRGPNGWERTPRATVYVHPRHFTYTQNGFLTVFDENYARYEFEPIGAHQFAPDPDRFIVAQYYSHMSSPLSAGLLRPLGIWMSIYIFNREWMLNFAQKHGSPFMDMTYKAGTPREEIDTMQQFLANGASRGYVMHQEGTVINVHPPMAMGTENPQRHLSEEADKQCQLLILGQTLTTDMPDSGVGSYAASQTHAEVRGDRIESLARWVAGSPLTQFAKAILRVNYGDDSECPNIVPDFVKSLTAQEKAALVQAFGNSPLPFLAEEVYKMLNMTVPEDGDKTIKQGKLGELGPTDDEISAIGLQGVEEVDQQLEMQEQQAKIAKKYATKPGANKKPAKASELRRILSQATPEDLAELSELVVKAKSASHANGELQAVQVKIEHIKERRFQT